MKTKKYLNKHIPIEMVQVTQENGQGVADWCGGRVFWGKRVDAKPGEGWAVNWIEIKTREGFVKAYPGDFIAKGIKGEFSPIGKEIHEKTYDEVEDK